MRLILASNSKTRKDIFDMVGWKYEVITSNTEENSNSTDSKQYKEISFTDITEVYFKNVFDKDIAWYVENEKYLLNRAGYSIAGKTSIFVDKIVGDYYNILGMPISKLYSKLNELGYSISDFEMKS